MRTLSDSDIKNYIENEYDFNEHNIEEIVLYTTAFEDGNLASAIFINDEFINCENDVISVKNNIIELQKDIKELGSFLYAEYGVIAKVQTVLFEGMKEECVF